MSIPLLESPVNKPAPQREPCAARISMLENRLPPSNLQTPKSVVDHAHRAVYDWFINHGLERGHERASWLDAFEFALTHKGKTKRGIIIGSAEHAAALAGATLWRAHNRSATMGGPGRGQGRKAIDGQTDLKRVSVNLRTDQRSQFKEVGGSAWLRAQLDRLRSAG